MLTQGIHRQSLKMRLKKAKKRQKTKGLTAKSSNTWMKVTVMFGLLLLCGFTTFICWQSLNLFYPSQNITSSLNKIEKTTHSLKSLQCMFTQTIFHISVFFFFVFLFFFVLTQTKNKNQNKSKQSN